MCRLRIPNGILTHWQLAGVADLAERYGGGYAHVTTRANLQIREIAAENAIAAASRAWPSSAWPRKGSGADNIRNVTGSPTAGIDPQELLDTRPYARAWHHHILNDRSLYGLPRKFNVGFDGGGVIPVLEDTNDIAFTAVRVGDGAGVEPGVWFRLGLGGITGHQDFARPTGVLVKPEDAVAVADAIVRVFIDHGDRTDRKKARLKYVLDAWGFEKFLAAVEAKLGQAAASRRRRAGRRRRNRQDRQAHIGVHAQKQAGMVWVGVALPVGKHHAATQMRGLAAIARELGDGDIRLTVWQNLLISGVADGQRGRWSSAPAGDRPHRQGLQHPRRPRRLHRQHRLQVRARPTPRTRRWRSPTWVRAARRARHADQHPPDRLPELLRAALHRRHRPARPAACRSTPTARTRSRASTCYVGGGFGAGCRHRPRDLSRREGRGLPAARRAHAARPISRIARGATRRSWRSPAATRSRRSRAMVDAVDGRPPHDHPDRHSALRQRACGAHAP